MASCHAPTSNRSSGPQARSHADPALPRPDARDESALAPPSLSGLDARSAAAGFLAGSCRSSSARGRRGARASCCRCWRPRPRAASSSALVDALDMLDVESAAAAGIDLDRLLWIRGPRRRAIRGCAAISTSVRIEQAIRALTLVLQAGNFGLVVFDAGEAPPTRSAGCRSRRGCGCSAWSKAARRRACWWAASAMARSSAGLTLQAGQRLRSTGFGGIAVRRDRRRGARRARHVRGSRNDVRVPLSTTCA